MCRCFELGARVLIGAALALMGNALAVRAQVAQPPASPPTNPRASQAATPPTAANTAEQSSTQQETGMIAGNIVDRSGTPVFGADVTLTSNAPSAPIKSQTDQNGHFSFANVSPGVFKLSITAMDFAPQTVSATLAPGEYHTMPQIKLTLVPVVTQIVVKPQAVIAQEQLHVEEKQRVLAVFPNFYVTYLPNPAPLDARQKFQLAWKSTFDPVTFFVVAAGAGLQQVDGQYSGFGYGFEGYAKRYGATYADIGIGTFLGDAVFPSVFKQDPRFFYKSGGSVRSRIWYALAMAVISKGDNGRWQPDYSNLLGDGVSGALSNLYYPPADRTGVALTFENVGISIGARAADNLVQEFLIPKLTFKSPFSHRHQHQPNHP